jgi:hypothetical protein
MWLAKLSLFANYLQKYIHYIKAFMHQCKFTNSLEGGRGGGLTSPPIHNVRKTFFRQYFSFLDVQKKQFCLTTSLPSFSKKEVVKVTCIQSFVLPAIGSV